MPRCIWRRPLPNVSERWPISIESSSSGPVRIAGLATGQPPGGGSPVAVATVALDSAAILTLGDGAVLIEAPGTDKFILPVSVVAEYVFGTTQYTTDGGDLTVNSGAFEWGKIGDTLLTGSEGTVGYIAHAVSNYNTLNRFNDQPLMLFDNVANPEDGDGSLLFTIIYAVVDLS